MADERQHAHRTNLAAQASPWTVAGTADITGDGKTNILWRNTTPGDVAAWTMNGAATSATATLGNKASAALNGAGTDWSVKNRRILAG